MSTQLATVPLNTQNIERSPLTSVQDDFVILDKYSPDGMAQFEEPRINAIATVSAGYRTDNNQVARTTDGTMFVHGDAPGLLEALQKRDRKALTIMFPSDNPRVFIQQRFTEYSATELKAYGDEKEITVIDRGQRVTYAVGSSGYAAALTRCKVAVSVYFTLAEWTKENEGGGCDMVFPDGFGMYRLRFTSMNSLRSILSSVRHMANTTGGKIAGIPFELFLREEEHSDPTGKKRRVWIWQCLPKPPMGIRLTPVVFRAIMESGQNQRQMLQLQAPASETMELAARDGQTLDLDTGEIVDAETVSVNANATNAQDADRVLEANLQTAQNGGKCDAAHWRATWFATVKETVLEPDKARAEFLMHYSHDDTDSLSNFLSRCNEVEANTFMNYTRYWLLQRAISDYETLTEESLTLGMRRVPLQDGLSLRQVQHYSVKLQEAVDRKKPPTPTVNGQVQNSEKNLFQSVHEKRVEASAPMSDDEKAEIDTIFAQPDDNAVKPQTDETIVEGELESDPDETAQTGDVVPIHIQNLLIAAGDKGLRTDDFMNSEAIRNAFNEHLQFKGRKKIKAVSELTARDATLLTAGITLGAVKW